MPGVVQAALGKEWEQLAPLVRRHFDLHPGSESELVLNGCMEVAHRGVGRLVFPVLGSFGVLVPYQGRDAVCTVRHTWQDGAMVWDREFRFPGRRPCRFRSAMSPAGAGRCAERVRFGFTIVMNVRCEGGALLLEDAGYFWQLGRRRLSLPLRWLLGALRVEERQEGDVLEMSLTLRHPWLGKQFLYRGRFTIA